MADSVMEYIEQLLQGCSVSVRDTPDCGRGLFATREPTGPGKPTIIFSEGPLGGIVQMSGSTRRRGGACCLCGHALGSPAWQLRLLTDVTWTGSESDILEEPLSDIVEGKPLFGKRSPLFCSSACHEEHERILGPLRTRRAAAQRFARNARKVQCAFYMLALKLICWCLAEAKKRPSAEAAAPLQALCRRPYWDAVDMPPKIDVESFKRKLAREAETSRQLALKALGGRDALPSDWDFLDETGYAHLIGALCCNCTVVVYMSPVIQHILQVTGMEDCAAKEAALSTLEPWIRALAASPPQSDDTSEGEKADQEISWNTPSGRLSFSSKLIPPFRGYAIYPRMVRGSESQLFSSSSLSEHKFRRTSRERERERVSERVLFCPGIHESFLQTNLRCRVWLRCPHFCSAAAICWYPERRPGGSWRAWEFLSFSAAGGTELTISYLDSSLDAQARQDSEEWADENSGLYHIHIHIYVYIYYIILYYIILYYTILYYIILYYCSIL